MCCCCRPKPNRDTISWGQKSAFGPSAAIQLRATRLACDPAFHSHIAHKSQVTLPRPSSRSYGARPIRCKPVPLLFGLTLPTREREVQSDPLWSPGGASKLNDKARHWLGEYRSTAASHVMPCATDARRGAVGSGGAAVGLFWWSGAEWSERNFGAKCNGLQNPLLTRHLGRRPPPCFPLAFPLL